MIRLIKQPEPQVLINNGAKWTATLLQKLALGDEPTSAEKSRYRHKEIKEALETETSGKCAYCESKLKHIHHGDVEHIYPKSLDPSKQFTWENLTLACEICNQNKSNLDPNLNHIIDPYQTNPKAHIAFLGAMAFALGTAKGTDSIRILDLNRTALMLMRQETVVKIMSIFDTMLRPDISLPAKKAILLDLEQNEASESVQFSAVAKALVDYMKTTIPAEILEP